MQNNKPLDSSVVRAYNLGLKITANVWGALDMKQIEYYENHLSEIPDALRRGFVIPKAPPRPTFIAPTDAPECGDCGSKMRRIGACFTCDNCGSSLGCS